MMRTIENLVFRGGGVLGMAYAGGIEVLDEMKILEQIKRVAGTSAGAVVALAVSLNYNSKECTTLINSTNFKDFEDGWDPLHIPTKYGLYRGDFLLNWIKQIVKKKTAKEELTFQEMMNLGYKELRVFATDLSKGTIQEFSQRETPNVSIAEAVRASMSIPLFFEAWQFKDHNPNDHIYVDGGMIYNYPITTFEMDKTLGFYLTNKEDMHTADLEYKQLIKYTEKLLITMFKSQELDFLANPKQCELSVIIDDFGISPIDFKITDTDKKRLFDSGKAATTAYFNK